MPTTSTNNQNIDLKPIPKRELLAYSAEVKYEIYRQIRKRFHQLRAACGFDQNHLAKRLGVDKSLVSRRLKGENDMRLETLSDLARGLDCRIEVTLTPLDRILTIADLKGYPFNAPTNTVVEIQVEEPSDHPTAPVWKSLDAPENRINAG